MVLAVGVAKAVCGVGLRGGRIDSGAVPMAGIVTGFDVRGGAQSDRTRYHS